MRLSRRLFLEQWKSQRAAGVHENDACEASLPSRNLLAVIRNAVLNERVHEGGAQWWNENDRGDAMDIAAGISFAAATGERYLRHLNMGRLEFGSLASYQAWGEAWPAFAALGLGPGVPPECLGFAGVLDVSRIA